MENQKEAEKDKESDVVDGLLRRRGAVYIHKYHTVGHQVLSCHIDL